MLVTLGLRLIWMQRGPMVVFRIDEIACGVLAAWLFVNLGRWCGRPWASLAAGIALLAGALTSALPIPQPFDIPQTSNAEVIGAAPCLPAALRLTRWAWWAERPVRWMASRSYALYMTHLTVLYDVAEKGLFEPGHLSAVACVPVAVGVLFVLAELSFRWLETPVLRLRPMQYAPAPYRAAPV